MVRSAREMSGMTTDKNPFNKSASLSGDVSPHPARRRGFTLIELLIVIAVIALLAAIFFRFFRGRGRVRGGVRVRVI